MALHYGDAAHELEHRILARGLIRPPRDASLGRVAATKQVVHIADIRTIPSYVERNPFVVTPAQSVLIDVGNILTGGGSSHQQTQNAPDQTQADAGGASDQTRRLVSAVLGSTEVVWGKMFQASGEQYEPPILVMFSGVTRSGCGFAQSAMGPFYCPLDHKVYLDTSFFQDLERRFRGCEVGSKACQFSQAYVITHEVGHHVQNLLGILPRVQRMQQNLDKSEANQLQVRVELQADCLAGVWANHSEQEWQFIEPGDVEAAMQTASAIGDDRLQRQSKGYVVPDAFTHGSSAQRTRWFMSGLKSGKVESCDTFSAASL